MALNWQKPGINHVGEFQSSGHVLVVAKNGSAQTVDLNFVSKAITFTNDTTSAQNVQLYDSGGVSATNFAIGANQSVKIDGKFLKFKIVGANISAVVELTNIPSGSYHQPAFTVLGSITT